MKDGIAQRVRDYCRRTYIEPARKRGDASVVIVSGEVQRALQLQNRTPAICQALRGQKFSEENGVVLTAAKGPQSGLGTTMTYTYSVGPGPESAARLSQLLELQGIGKDVYASFGGGEAYLREMRRDWYGDPRDEQ